MADESKLAQRYERLYPGTGCPEGQKEERMQRIDFDRERAERRRTGRSRGIVVPELPWLRKDVAA